jgi:MoaA/NifB/PqqE/SkfB family radical SAM enzyme
MNLSLFGETLRLRDYNCAVNEGKPTKADPYINLFIKIDKCNAKCAFCCYSSTCKTFNLPKLVSILKEIQQVVPINKLAFTGGEPTLNVKLFKDIFEACQVTVPEAFTVLNTNGLNLERLVNGGIISEIGSVSLSRHHFDDKRNSSIFGVKTISKDTICELQKKFKKIHLTCNLIKGEIDSGEMVREYLEFASKVGIYDVGFVGLMKNNDFSREHLVKFEDGVEKLFNNRSLRFGNSCRCKNYLYFDKETCSIPVKVYHRHVLKPSKMESMLVYDGENLTVGFTGKKLK